MFRESVARFVAAEVAPHARRWRKQGIVDRDVYRKAGKAGLLCMWADKSFGAAGDRAYRRVDLYRICGLDAGAGSAGRAALLTTGTMPADH